MEPATAGTADADLCARICELQETLSAATIALEISSAIPGSRRSKSAGTRCAPATTRSWISGARTWPPSPAASRLLCRDYKGKEADRLVTRIDSGVVSLLAVRAHEQQAAEECRQWETRVEERKPIDASPAAITLALLLTGEELDLLDKRAGDGEIAMSRRPGGSKCHKPSTVCAPW